MNKKTRLSEAIFQLESDLYCQFIEINVTPLKNERDLNRIGLLLAPLKTIVITNLL